jgi:hypothetical protein
MDQTQCPGNAFFSQNVFLPSDDDLFAGQASPQKFVVLEFSNGGTDLEHITFNNAVQGRSQ